MSAWAVIVAAGRGERSGLNQNKVFFEYGGRSVLSRCLDAFAASGEVDGIVLVLSEGDREAYAALCRREGVCPLVRAIANGGATRRDSVHNGLRAVPEDAELVAIHDAARPFVTKAIISATLNSARLHGSGVICTPVIDTIKQIKPDGRVTTVERDTLRAVQTPQSFAYQKILEAHRRALAEGLDVTDDAMLYEHYYGDLRLVTAEGAERNRKLTTKADFEALSGKFPDLRVGQGYDAHRLKAGRKLILCGVDVPHDRGLDGHSDADVAVHALMDALLGAIGAGDIGKHFPDSDPAYKGISSMKLLGHVMGLLREQGWRVVNADVTIVAQKPKLAAHIPQMRQNLIDALDTGAVNVKATTT
ncbi:MAG: 2-C-methyl-D-erythritol 4-phosphate cytidylyltransferase, partial [bacterium]